MRIISEMNRVNVLTNHGKIGESRHFCHKCTCNIDRFFLLKDTYMIEIREYKLLNI